MDENHWKDLLEHKLASPTPPQGFLFCKSRVMPKNLRF